MDVAKPNFIIHKFRDFLSVFYFERNNLSKYGLEYESYTIVILCIFNESLNCYLSSETEILR